MDYTMNQNTIEITCTYEEIDWMAQLHGAVSACGHAPGKRPRRVPRLFGRDV